jgi:hypothetical protein
MGLDRENLRIRPVNMKDLALKLLTLKRVAPLIKP